VGSRGWGPGGGVNGVGSMAWGPGGGDLVLEPWGPGRRGLWAAACGLWAWGASGRAFYAKTWGWGMWTGACAI
jgi:hypothetical protein